MTVLLTSDKSDVFLLWKSGFGSNSLYLLFLNIYIDIGTIYNAFEQRFDDEENIEWRSICEKSIANLI